MALFILNLLGCGALGVNCNMMYAPDMLTIEITDEAGWSGDVVATVTGDGATIDCSFSDDGFGNCSDGSNVFVTEDQMTLMLWEFTPDVADFSLSIDGVDVFAEALEPVYDEDEPNGQGCGVRSYATVQVSL